MPKRPNVLLITSDQQHWDTLSCLDSAVQTPNLDRLAARGTLFERAYCPNPTCTPTRATIITGQPPSQHGAWTLGTKLPDDAPTVGEDFIAAGYRTALVGKAHFQPLASEPGYESVEAYPALQDLDFWRTFNDTRTPWYGFDHVELARNHTDEAHVGQHYVLWLEEKGCANWRDYFQGPTGTRPHGVNESDAPWPIPMQYHYNTWISERTSALMEQYAAADEPFFLWSSFFDPHPSYLVPEPWYSMYDPATITVPQGQEGEHKANPPHFGMTQDPDADWSSYHEPEGSWIHGSGCHVQSDERKAKNLAVYYGMVSCLDHHVGLILDKLEELGLADNTVVVFTTDHGHFLGQHNLTKKCIHHYEDLVKIPFIVSWPGQVPAGRRSTALQSLTDLAPTFLDCCGLDVPRSMTGSSQQAVWRGDDGAAPPAVIVENHHQPTTFHAKTLITDRYKLTCYAMADYGELWDLEEDPGEFHNRWNDPAFADLKSRLLLQLLQTQMHQEPMWMPRIAGA